MSAGGDDDDGREDLRPRLILGSASPRRRELLAQIGVVADEVRPADIDETPLKAELARPYCARVTLAKAAATERTASEVVLVADTTVAMGRRILGKPEDEKEAAAFLLALSGRRHRVVTCVAVASDKGVRHRVVESQVRMKRLSDAEVNGYLASGDWRGKAGGYAIQGPAGTFIPWISGSYSAIMGLPLAETAVLLRDAGYAVEGGWS
ncbi:MAG: septum formation protein Maf [Boseongicola sp.]|nr:septum formation protein Maf [Boseongicola sp.]